MFSLQRLLGKEDKFFDLLEASAEEARTSVQALVKLSKKPGQTNLLYDFIQSRRKEKQIRAADHARPSIPPSSPRWNARTLTTFPTRSTAFPRPSRNSANASCSPRSRSKGVDFSKQINLLEQATDTVLDMVKSLRAGAQPGRNQGPQRQDCNTSKARRTKPSWNFTRTFTAAAHDPIKVIVLKDLYELLEKVIDRCRDVGNVISQIVLKNS